SERRCTLAAPAPRRRAGAVGLVEVQPRGVDRRLVAVLVEEPVRAEGDLVTAVLPAQAVRVYRREARGQLERPWHDPPELMEERAALDVEAFEPPHGAAVTVGHLLPVVLVLERDAAPREGALDDGLRQAVQPVGAVGEAVHLAAAVAREPGEGALVAAGRHGQAGAHRA